MNDKIIYAIINHTSGTPTKNFYKYQSRLEKIVLDPMAYIIYRGDDNFGMLLSRYLKEIGFRNAKMYCIGKGMVKKTNFANLKVKVFDTQKDCLSHMQQKADKVINFH